MKKLITLIACFASISSIATVPHKMEVPDIPGYITLKGDFHIHTVFSDARTWPTDRVDEAYYDDLDVISITDHLDSRQRKMVKKGLFVDEACTRNTSFEIASAYAEKLGIIVIHGGEITRGLRLFPGHFNAHFLQDGDSVAAMMESEDKNISDLVTREETGIKNGLKEARKQKAFLIWNHPNWEHQEPNDVIWHPFHNSMYNAGLMDGIEIINQTVGFSPEAFHMAMEHNLTIVSGTDCHVPMNQIVDYELGEHRAMTLLFVKERSSDGVREALESHRTIVYTDGSVYGKEELIKPFLEACIKVDDLLVTPGKVSVKVKNICSIPIKLKKAPGSEIVVMPRVITINPGEEMNLQFVPVRGEKLFQLNEFSINYYVENFQIDADKPFVFSYKVKL